MPARAIRADGVVGELQAYAVMLLAAALALSIPLHFEPCSERGALSYCYFGVTPGYTLYLSDTDITMRFGGAGSGAGAGPRFGIAVRGSGIARDEASAAAD